MFTVARSGGVLERAGHTKLRDISKLTKLNPSAVIVKL